jgi:hypothetical protein
MTDRTTTAALDDLGDALGAAIDRELHRDRRRPGPRRIALVLGALALLTAGTAAAAGLFSPKQVAQGMPAGTAIFDQTDPTCVANPDGTSFRCTLSRAPGQEDGIGDFTGTKEVLAIDGIAAGGCIGLDVAGMTWDCYLGQDAVDHEIISQDFLGEPILGPGRG